MPPVLQRFGLQAPNAMLAIGDLPASELFIREQIALARFSYGERTRLECAHHGHLLPRVPSYVFRRRQLQGHNLKIRSAHLNIPYRPRAAANRKHHPVVNHQISPNPQKAKAQAVANAIMMG